ncbi:MAG: glutaredoxin family protein [Burkholderiales bacterium]|nr:glutaredoxin family protein [Burkholderiales bacterium]
MSSCTARLASRARGFDFVSAIAPVIVLALGFTSAASLAQYKVVGPDGKTTFTDRPPPATEGLITALNRRGAAPTTDTAWHAELREPVARFPVTLFVTTSPCAPCDAARQLLRQRGIPFSEKTVTTQRDVEAFEKLSGGRDAPTLLLGTQVLRGLAADLWNSYLDAAGYPRESRLPADYQQAPAVPLTEKLEVARTPPPRRPPARESGAPAPAGVSIKF